MNLVAILIVAGGVAIIAWIYLWSRQRQNLGEALHVEQRLRDPAQAAARAAHRTSAAEAGGDGDAVLMANEHGQLVYTNEQVRRWVGVDGGLPDLEFIARMAQPADSFLELFSGESQAAFQLGNRWVEASSHYVPTGNERRLVIRMRELGLASAVPRAAATGDGGSSGQSGVGTQHAASALNLNQAMMVIHEISETVNASMGLEPVLQALLAILNKVVLAQAGEICLWDEAPQVMRQRAWIGDTQYLLTMADTGGVYHLDEGIPGWIAHHRRPLLIADRNDPTAIQPKIDRTPYKSIVGVPLTVNGGLLASLEFFHMEPGTFNQAHLALLQAVRTPVAVAIHNAQLYSEQVQRVSDVASVASVAQLYGKTAGTGTGTLLQNAGDDAGPVYHALAQRIAELMSSDICGVLLYNEDRRALVPELPFSGLPAELMRNFSIPLPPDSPQREVWERRSEWLSNDVVDDSFAEMLGLTPLVNAAGLHCAVLVPMQIGGTRIGMLLVGNKQTPGGYSNRDLQNLHLLATQAAIVVENIRLYQREKRIDAELVGLQEITHAIGALSHEGEFYSEITERIAKLMDIQMCGILLHDEAEQCLKAQLPFFGVAADAQPLIAGYRIELKPGTIFTQIWTEEDHWLSNRAQSDALVFEAGLDALAQAFGVQKTLIAVMSAGGRRIGVVQVSNKRGAADFTDNDARLLLIFATQAAAIIENARLVREVQRSAEHAQSLRRVAELAGAAITTEDTFMPVLAEISRLTQSMLVFINVLDFQTGSLTTYPRWVYGMELHEPIAQSINTPDFDYSVAVSHNPYMSNDVLNDKRALPGYLTLAQRFNITKAIIVPLVVADRGLGELGVSNPIDRNYTPDDVSLLQTVSSQIAAALERLRLYEATGQNLTRRMQELDAISRVSNELTLTLELDKILDVIRHEAAQATGATGSTVALLKPVEVWKAPDKPELDRRVGAGNMLPGLADIEREAIARGADTVLVTDYEHSAMKPSPKQSRSAIASAILYVDQVVGVIHLQHDQPNHFDDRAATFLMTLSSKASLGYGNAIRYKEQLDRSTRLRRRVDQLNQIFELGHLPHNNTDPLSMLEAICYSVQQSVGFDTVAIALVDEPARELRRVAFAGLPVEVFEATKNNGFPVDRLKELLDKGDYRIGESFFFPVEDLRKWYVEGASALSLTFAGNRTMESHGKQMWHDGDLLLVKMTGSDGNLIGVMTLDRPYDNQRPDRTTFEILEIFAHQAATAVENARLYISTTRSAEQEARINEVMEAVASTLDIDHIVESVARGMYSLVPFSRMSVALLDATEQGFDMLRIVPRGQGDFEVTMDHRPSLANTALARSYQEGVDYVYLPGDSEGASYNDLQEWFKNGEQISLVLPLVTGGQRLGAMHLGSDTPKFTGFIESRTVLRRMAQLTAGAVQNTRLFNQAVNLQVLNQSVVMSIQQGIVVLNNSGQIISINDFMRQRYGWDNRAIHADLFEYRPPWAEFLAQDVREVLENGALHDRINQRFVDENGRENVSSFYTYPLRSDNVIRGAVLLVEDVTERWELEKAIENRANQLAALTEVSSRITASLERDEVIALALKEMGWVIPYDTMTVWRRNGSFMVLEGASGVPSLDTGTPLLEQDIRIRFALYERVRQTVETQRVVTVSTEQGFEEGLPGEENAKSWMGVPLVNQGHVIGMIVLTKNQPGVYEGASEQHVAFAFASQVAIALANADLFEQTFDRTNELGILLEAAQATSLTRDLDDVFRTVVELMFSALDVDDCAIMLWDEVDNSLEVQVDMNRSGDTNRVIPKGTRLNLADYPAKLKALRDREVIVIVADDEAQTYPSEQKELRERDDSARLLVPLVVREQSIGLIQLEQQATNRLVTQQKVRLSRALGSQVAVAIENARLATETSHQFEELLLINDLSRAISGTLNLEDMIKIVRDQVPAVTGSDELYVALYDAETEEITFPLAVRAGKDFAIPPRKLNTDEVSFIIRHRQPLSLGADYYSPDEMRRNLGITNGEGDTKSYMGVPLIAGDQVVGVLAVRDSQRTRAFTLNDRRILTTVGSQLGAAIQNARLFSQVSNFADDLNRIVEDRTSELAKERDRIDTLYQITSELARTLDMDRLLNRALGMVAKAVGAEDGAILLIDSITDQLYTRSALNPGALIPGDPDSHPTHPAESIATWLIEHERAVVVDDLHDADYWNPEAQGAVAWRSALGVILETNEDIQGVMVLLARKPAAFSDSHLRLLVAAANQVASAINNADLYQLIRDQAERLGKLLRAEQEEAEKNSAILEGIADGVILADANGGVILFNSAAERILGVAREQIIGQSLSKLSGLYTGSAPWLQAIQEWANRDWSQTGAGEVGDFVDERLDLGEKVVSIHLSPVHINDAFLGTVSVFRDITRDVEVDRMKSEFIANVSHELRTPMTSIKGYADLMLMGAAGLPTDSQKQFLTVIKENADRLTSLVEDVLDISRIDSGREKLKVDAIDLQDLIDDVVSNLIAQPHHQQKEIHLTTQIDSNVPVIQADHDKLAQALTNIVDNAFNYTHPGGSIDIRVQMQADDKHVLISVSDTGIGIPEDFREAIWRRFERYEQHALVMDVPGTGLGLPIVKELVSMHHGDVWFESELNKGTTFYISLPVDQSGFPATTATTEVVRFGSEGAGRD